METNKLTYTICTLCLNAIMPDDKTIVVDDRIRHKECSDKLEKMIEELDEIYQDTKPDNI